MALSFPNSPTDGQIFTDTATGNRWSWDNANTCWKSTSTFTQTITVAATAPGSPVVGQLWWNQDYGRLLVYYNDGTSSQWVDASPSDYTSAQAYNTANAAFGKANTALQNTTGTFSGTLYTTGSLAVATNIIPTVAPLTVNNVGKQFTLMSYGGSQNCTASFECIRSDFTGNSSALAIYTNTGAAEVERMRIDTNGNVGIGTNSPQYRLDVVGGTSSGLTVRADGGGASSNNAGINFSNYTSGTSSSRYSQITLDPNGGNFAGGDYLLIAMYGDGPAYIWNQLSGAIVFGQGGTGPGDTTRERMRIDTSGRVTIPAQPAFHVYDAVGTATSAGTYIKNTNLTNVVHNIGSNYDTSTCRFTAPVAGKYFFYYGCNIIGAQVHDVMIYVNGTGRVRAYANPASSVWTFQMAQAMISLSVNDYIEFYYSGDPDSGLTWHYAGGYLLG